MPFRLGPGRAKIQFLTSASMPMNIYDARQKVGVTSQTRYIQLAVCAALSRDLGIDYEELVRELPEYRGSLGGIIDQQVRESVA
jgi:hypothetical protein